MDASLLRKFLAPRVSRLSGASMGKILISVARLVNGSTFRADRD
jgi:hypothetical protein